MNIGNTDYEVVWYANGKMYVYEFAKQEGDEYSEDLPDPVATMLEFISSRRKSIPVLVYRLHNPEAINTSVCFSNFRRFGNAKKWLLKNKYLDYLKKHGYEPNEKLLL